MLLCVNRDQLRLLMIEHIQIQKVDPGKALLQNSEKILRNSFLPKNE